MSDSDDDTARTDTADDGTPGAEVPDAPAGPTPRMLAWARNSAAWRISRKMMTERELSDAVSRKARQKFEDIPEEHVALLACAAVDFGRMAGAIDDANYAEVKTRSLTGSGRSRRMIARKLAEKGVGQELIAETLVDADDTDAAIIFARKRAFGPFRKVEPDQKRMTKELSAFARNGFSLALARHVLEMDRDEAEEQLLGRHRLL